MTEHIALIPAKETSSRCANKNWRPFVSGMSLVSYLISILPDGFFDKVILSTDKKDVESTFNVVLHNRDKALATKESPVNDLISEIINKYDIHRDSYIWLLNPTSPLRKKEDFYNIKEMVAKEHYTSVVSVSEIGPFIWRDDEPLFETGYPRKNTQSFKRQYCVENGQFIVFKVESFQTDKSWYGDNRTVYKQKKVQSLVDIDTDDDFTEAQQMLDIDSRCETLKNETLSIEHIIKEPVREHVKLLFNHFQRYDLAIRKLDITTEDTVIDSSCGKGYGSFLLSEKAQAVYGVDINEDYLKTASAMFNADNCTFVTYDKFYDMYDMSDTSKVDKVVCIETIEHIPKDDVEGYVSKLLSCLKTGGDMFLTFPVGNNGPSCYNKYHHNEPTIDYISDMFESRFKKIQFDVDEFRNSFGYEVKYCVATMNGKMEIADEIQP